MGKYERTEFKLMSEDLRWWNKFPSVRRKLRFYADHHFPRESAWGLRETGYDIWYVQEHPKARHQDDSFHYRQARQMKRLLITLDEDYLDDQRYPLHQSPGVILIRAKHDKDPNMPGAMLAALLAPILKEGTNKLPNLWSGSKVILSVEQIIWRQLTYESKVEEMVIPL